MYRTQINAVTAALFVVFVSLFASSEAKAQRTMRYQNILTGQLSVPYAKNPDIGGVLSYGQYTLNGYWSAGIKSIGRTQPEGKYNLLQTQTLRLYGEYMHRLISDRKRIINLYCGGGPFIGYEFYDPFGRLPDHIQKSIEDNAFIYGIKGSIEIEIFLMKKIAFVLGANMPLTFGSESSWFRGNSTAGLRINL